MSKIICDVCGTSYPEASAQCPICGCVRSADAPSVAALDKESSAAAPYQHVKGGRFSKANVKKRNAAPQPQPREASSHHVSAPVSKPAKKKQDAGSLGLVITIFVLLLAILVVIGYIAFKIWGDSFEDRRTDGATVAATVDTTPTDPTVLCEQIILENEQYALESIGQMVSLKASVSPENTTEQMMYISDNEAVVTVDDKGILTAIGYGEANITVQCGSVTVQCPVTVMPPLALDQTELTLDTAGQTQNIYSGAVPAADIIWSVDNNAVATVENGVVTAVGAGTATITAEYNGQIVSCNVVCNLATVPTETTDPTESTQAPTTANTYKEPYSMKNLTSGLNKDVTMYPGKSFEMVLVDANGERIKEAKWEFSGSYCTLSVSENGICTVTRVSGSRGSMATLTATYNGQTVKCIVRLG